MRKFLLSLAGILLPAMYILAQKKDMTLLISAAADKIEPKTIAWRRDFHEHPELGNREVRTAKIIADHLRSLGLEVKEGVGKTGVVGILRGAKPGPVIGLRADMDGLPLVERTSLPFASKVRTTYNGQEVGVMHACGHDSHIAILMSVAEVLAGMKQELKGTVKFVFQPAEEGPPTGEEGGAPLMIKEGVLDNPKVEVMFGLHINSATESGKIKYRSAGAMAASDWFTLKVKGKGTHGSQPWGGIDPVVVSAQIITGLQTIISRQTELTKDPAVISVCVIKGGIRSNIIPEEVEMLGTIRTLDTAMQRDIHEKMQRTVTKIAESAGATAELSIENKTLITYNNPGLVKKMLPSLQKAAGEDNVTWIDAMTGSEDFSFFGDKVPSFFFFLGGMKKGQDPHTAFPHHTPDFYIDEAGFKTGVKAFCQLVVDYAGSN
ncbi:amidohydrolase [Flavitalea sp. BT771]|uniref:amidohydrolase n=1 Tax=Flavitalea sp. BT771 TaxID=3063329 RepID=UPI0026E2A766|nr:amidohydrolase [Flavitalea sp. BT771]MDO6433340.1 amidohydrolase [Flavitalea sp. BT771]MDV6222755.1 amidohydrolase [Flavitalea sp. BT771]